jgi:hypothetical protein
MAILIVTDHHAFWDFKKEKDKVTQLVFPALSKPNIKIRISLFPKTLAMSFEKLIPIVIDVAGVIESWV